MSHHAFAQEWQIEGAISINKQSESQSMGNFKDGFLGGIAYSHYLSDQWSIGLGASYETGQFYNEKGSTSGHYDATDMEGEDFEFRYDVDFFSEKDKWKTLNIPLTLQYETKGEQRWYIRTGISYGLMLGNTKARSTYENVQTSGYYEQYDAELTGPEFAGFGDFGNQEKKESIDYKDRFTWLIETGVKQNITGQHYIYMGVFLEMGLNDFSPDQKNDENMIEYRGEENQALAYKNNWDQKTSTDKSFKSYNFGFRIRYGFGG